MDETPLKNTTFEFQEEIDINLNDLFTIDFKNLKIFLTTVLKNQNELSKKIKDLEKKLKEQDTKCYKNFSQIEKRVKIIEKTSYPIKSEQENIPKDSKEKEEKNLTKENQKEAKEDKIETKDKEKKEDKTDKKEKYLTSKGGLEIIRNKENFEKDKENDKLETNKEEKIKNKKDDNPINKTNEKEEDEDNNSYMRKRSQRTEGTRKEKGEDSKNNTIPEEESIKSGNESDIEKGQSNLNESQNEFNRSKSSRKYEEPYRNIPIKGYNYDKFDEFVHNYLLMKSDIDEIKKKIDALEKKNKSKERGRFLSLKSLDTSANEDLQFLKLQIKDLLSKNDNLENENAEIQKDLEEIKVKIKDFDIYELFKDAKLDQGSIDASRALVMSLEQKVFKKTGLIDEKLRRLEDGINKMEVENKNTKNIAEILKLSSEDIRRMIKNLEESENKNAEDYLNILNDINDFKNEYKKRNISLDQIINDIDKKNKSLNDKIQQNLTDILGRLTETENNLSKLDQFPKSRGDAVDNEHFKKLKVDFNEAIKELKKKDTDLEKQIELLKLNPDLSKAKDDILKLEKELTQKISNKEFLDLKDKLSLQNLNINNLRDNIDRISEISNKAKNDMGFLLKRVESLSAAQVSTRTALDELIGKEQEFIFDSSKYLELTAFNKFLAGFQKEKEKNEQNINSIHKLLNEMAEIIKTKSSSDDMKIFEEIINNKLEELKIYSIKKFTDKIENNKSIKYLDSQIRHIIDVYIKKLDKADSWLIAKKPLGGYSCASCEAYLGELKKSQDYMPWNKYPNREREKNFRLGNGFSKMLNMLNIDFKSQIDAIKDNAYESENEEGNSSENKVSRKRMSRNLSNANIINTPNNKNILPKIPNSNSKGDNLNINLSLDMDAGGIGTTNESGGVNNDNEGLPINIEHNEDQPHVVKVYRKNKVNNSETQKKI